MLAAMRFVFSHPVVGAGVGGDILVLNEELGPAWSEIHNAYLQYAVELGLPGLALFLLLFATSLRGVSGIPDRAKSLRETRSLRHLADAIRLGLIAFGVAAFFHPIAYHFYFYYLAGLSAAFRTILAQGAQGKATSAIVHVR